MTVQELGRHQRKEGPSCPKKFWSRNLQKKVTQTNVLEKRKDKHITLDLIQKSIFLLFICKS